MKLPKPDDKPPVPPLTDMQAIVKALNQLQAKTGVTFTQDVQDWLAKQPAA